MFARFEAWRARRKRLAALRFHGGQGNSSTEAGERNADLEAKNAAAHAESYSQGFF